MRNFEQLYETELVKDRLAAIHLNFLAFDHLVEY